MGLPDENIHPHATGRAATTVAEHQGPQDLIFYSGWFCPYVQRVWIVLEERGIPYQYKEVNPYKKEPHFLAINPKGLVPAIEYKGRALHESLIICEFLEDAFPALAPHLLPSDPFDRALVRLWTDHVNKQVVPAYMRLIQQQDPEKQRALLEELTKALRTLCAQVKGPYFLGEEFTLVDVALAPWVTRDWVVAENRGYSREAVGGGWAEYAARLDTRRDWIRVRVSPRRKVRGYISQRYMAGTCATRRRARARRPSGLDARSKARPRAPEYVRSARVAENVYDIVV